MPIPGLERGVCGKRGVGTIAGGAGPVAMAPLGLRWPLASPRQLGSEGTGRPARAPGPWTRWASGNKGAPLMRCRAWEEWEGSGGRNNGGSYGRGAKKKKK